MSKGGTCPAEARMGPAYRQDCACRVTPSDPCPCETAHPSGICACCRADDHNGGCATPANPGRCESRANADR